jgi:hypothetical protein
MDKKLKGEFALIKAYGRGENGWLLMKLKDKYATTVDITLKNKSVISKKTIAQMQKSSDNVYGKNIPIQQELEKMKLKAVIDGEIVVLGKKGSADFGSLQNWRSETDGDLVYYVFKILWYEGKDLKEHTLIERKTILEQILPQSDSILISQDFHTSGIEFLKAAKKMRLEGIMAKRKDSLYHTKTEQKAGLKSSLTNGRKWSSEVLPLMMIPANNSAVCLSESMTIKN